MKYYSRFIYLILAFALIAFCTTVQAQDSYELDDQQYNDAPAADPDADVPEEYDSDEMDEGYHDNDEDYPSEDDEQPPLDSDTPLDTGNDKLPTDPPSDDEDSPANDFPGDTSDLPSEDDEQPPVDSDTPLDTPDDELPTDSPFDDDEPATDDPDDSDLDQIEGDEPDPDGEDSDASLSGTGSASGSISQQAASANCSGAAGKVIYILDGNGIHSGATYLKPNAKVEFFNDSNVTHRIRITPPKFFSNKSFTITPNSKVLMFAGSPGKVTGGSIVVNPGKSQTVQDVVICPAP